MSYHPGMTRSLLHSLERQREAALRDPVPAPAARRAALGRLSRMLRTNVESLHRAIESDFGTRAKPETVLAEILPVLEAIDHSSRHLAAWMRPRRRRVPARLQPGRAWVRPVPLGCVGILSPWNYPLLLSLMPLVDALAAGNRVMLKPSEHAPASASLLAHLIGERFDEQHLMVVEGDVQRARDFGALPFDHLLFTGSTRAGREVARAAAAGLVPTTLELGGKAPVIVCADALRKTTGMVRVAHSIAVGKFFNAGQTCLAPDYVLAPRAQSANLAAALAAAAARLYPTIADNPDYTSLLRDGARDHLSRLVDEIPASRVLRHPEDRADRQTMLAASHKLPPVVLHDPDPDSGVMREELFGPVLPVLSYDRLAEAVAFVNRRPAPLALYCYSNDPACQRHLEHEVRCGGMTINNTLLHGGVPDLPFGGLGESGMGCYHGRDGFMRLSHNRAVYRSGGFSGFTWMSPPHGRTNRLLLRLMLRR